MIGALIGDIVGSRYEWNNINTKEFPLFDEKCSVTDDSVITIAIAKAILDCNSDYRELSDKAIDSMKSYGRNYPNVGYGRNFEDWIKSSSREPYYSFGNGAAMRVSACAYAASSIEEAVTLAREVTKVTHNHPEGLKGAEAVAVAIYLALHGEDIGSIKKYIENNYYTIDFSLDELRCSYKFDSSCQGSVPQALEAFFESENFEDAIRNAISIGGDSDTIAAITGSVAGAYYVIPEEIKKRALEYLPEDLLAVYYSFNEAFASIDKAEEELDIEEESGNLDNHLDIEGEVEQVESDAFYDETRNLESNYRSISDELLDEKAALPYPNVHPYDTASDYDEVSDLQYMKRKNEKHWEAIDIISQYDDCSALYVGHLSCNSDSNFYIMENPNLRSKTLRNGSHLLNSDDKDYIKIVNAWMFPDKDKDAKYSCKLGIENKKLQYVDVQLNKENELYADITDAYLRNALIRNKRKVGINSIIQTIQEKQNAIRSLPVNSSFIVQGCAGSGKTMVLLHRLRYLIYNEELQRGSYIVLLPEKSLKDAISQVSSKFSINLQSLKTYQEYYKELSGRGRDDNEEENELVFNQAYLEDIYSESFIRECFDNFVRDVLDKSEVLIEDCEKVLNDIVENENGSILANIKSVEQALLAEYNKMCDAFGLEEALTDIAKIPQQFAIMQEKIEEMRRLAELTQIDESSISIDSNDERITNNHKLALIRADIEKASAALSKASFFTANSHKRKLAQLEKLYESEFKIVEAACIQEDIEKLKNEVQMDASTYSPEELEQILHDGKCLYAQKRSEINSEKEKLENFEEFFASKYKDEISHLNIMIEKSEAFYYSCESDINSLTAPIHYDGDIFQNDSKGNNAIEAYVRETSKLLEMVSDVMDDSNEKQELVKKHILFNKKTDAQLAAYLTTLLFNTVRRTVKSKHNKKLNPIYKHYWYLYLYSFYLTRGAVDNGKSFLFIDEAQDLSIAEHNLLNKLHVKKNFYEGMMVADTQPVFNLFGDVNQTISSFGIKDWDAIQFISTQYQLNENFRNTNQIIDYCNNKLGIQMAQVGVDLNKVNVFDDFSSAQKSMNLSKKTYIVKDECAKEDLKVLLSKRGVARYEVLTVKGAKGLEFREVVVVQRDMQKNEKYIAYTRALQQLNIINNLPHYTDETKDYSVDGSESEQEE